ARASEDLPQPDSPTMPSAPPGATRKLTSSTARSRCLPERAYSTTMLSASSSHSVTFDLRVAGDEMRRRNLDPRQRLLAAVADILAARGKRAAGRQAIRPRRLAGNRSRDAA